MASWIIPIIQYLILISNQCFPIGWLIAAFFFPTGLSVCCFDCDYRFALMGSCMVWVDKASAQWLLLSPPVSNAPNVRRFWSISALWEAKRCNDSDKMLRGQTSYLLEAVSCSSSGWTPLKLAGVSPVPQWCSTAFLFPGPEPWPSWDCSTTGMENLSAHWFLKDVKMTISRPFEIKVSLITLFKVVLNGSESEMLYSLM